MEQLITPKVLAQTLCISVNTLYQLVHERRIPFCKPSHKVLRFRPSEIEAWLKNGGAGPAGRPPVKQKQTRKPRPVKDASSGVDALVAAAVAEATK